MNKNALLVIVILLFSAVYALIFMIADLMIGAWYSDIPEEIAFAASVFPGKSGLYLAILSVAMLLAYNGVLAGLRIRRKINAAQLVLCIAAPPAAGFALYLMTSYFLLQSWSAQHQFTS